MYICQWFRDGQKIACSQGKCGSFALGRFISKLFGPATIPGKWVHRNRRETRR